MEIEKKLECIPIVNSLNTELCVIGSGPAGCSAAFVASSKGIQVTVLESGLPFKEKVCGDAFMPVSIDLLQKMGFEIKDLNKLNGKPFSEIEIETSATKISNIPLSKKRNGWVIPRASIDQAFREKVSTVAQVIYGCKGLKIERDSLCYPLKIIAKKGDELISIRCKGIILATGANNRISKKFKICGLPTRAVAVTQTINKILTKNPRFILENNSLNYFWTFPYCKQSSNVGYFSTNLALNGIPIRVDLQKFVKTRGLTYTSDIRAGLSQIWSDSKEKIWHSSLGILSCGEAGGLTNPITGEGIGPALVSGFSAGFHMSSYLKEDNNDYLLEYSSWIKNYFGIQYNNLCDDFWDNLINNFNF